MRDGIKVGIIYAMNAFDFFATYALVGMYGLSIEKNPIGAALLENPRLAGMVKLVAAGFGLLLLHYVRELKLAKIGINLLFCVYFILTLYHITIIAMLASV